MCSKQKTQVRLACTIFGGSDVDDLADSGTMGALILEMFAIRGLDFMCVCRFWVSDLCDLNDFEDFGGLDF